MDKIISFGKGIRRQPSISEDGELSELVNLIPKNGELVNVRPMGKVEDAPTLLNNSTLLAIHEVGGRNNYIFIGEGNVIKYAKYDDTKKEWVTDSIVTLNGYKSSAVIGNTLVVSDNDGLKYAIWRDGKYSFFSQSDFNFNIRVTNKESKYLVAGESYIDDTYFDTDVFNEDKQTNIFKEIDTDINEVINTIEENYSASEKNKLFKYVSFGIAAMKLYDGSYIAYSKIFSLDPIAEGNGIREVTFTKTTSTGGDTFRTMLANATICKYNIEVFKDLPDGMKDLVSGVDVFITQPMTFYDFSRDITLTKESSATRYFNFNLKPLKEIYNDLDNAIFYKSISITIEDFGEKADIKRVSGSEPSIALVDVFDRGISADRLFVYNGRLNAANITYMMPSYGKLNLFQNGTGYGKIQKYDSEGNEIVFQGYYNEVQDAYSLDTNYEYESAKTVEAIVEIDFKEDDVLKTNRYYGNISFPLPPILSYSTNKAQSIRLYIKHQFYADTNDTIVERYIKRQFDMYSMLNKDISIYVNTSTKGLSYIQPYKILVRESEEGVIERLEEGVLNEGWTEISKDEFESVKSLTESSDMTLSVKKNLIKYTSVNNPFAFSAINSSNVGNEGIIDISTAAKALSQGQFGQFPLYALCNDGIWALEVAGDGSYSAKQPISRDVCNNPNSVTQIDGAVVFSTDQGLKLIQGSEVVLLSGQMDGHNVDESIYFPQYFFIDTSKNQEYEVFDRLVVNETRDFRTILSTCKIAYDYPNRLLRIFPEGGGKWYVYSLDTREFASEGALGVVNAVVAGYPTPLVQIGTTLYTFGNEVDSNTLRNGLLLTRPIDMGEPFAMKKLQDMKLHYTKHYKKKNDEDEEDTFVKVVVYVSNDGEHWYVLPSMRKRAFKYYRVALITKMTDNDALSGMIMRYELERTNKIR